MSNMKAPLRELWLPHDPRIYKMHAARAREPRSGTPGRGPGAARRFLARIVARAHHSIVSAIRKRRTIAELSRLDDRMLADIGIERARIPMVAQDLTVAPSGEVPRWIVPAAPCPPEHRDDAANDAKPPSRAA